MIKQRFTKPRATGETPGELRGILRALHLDDNWLQVRVDGQHIRVYEVSEEVDDIVGPLVNHRVVVQIVTSGAARCFEILLPRDSPNVSNRGAHMKPQSDRAMGTRHGLLLTNDFK